MSTLLKTAWGVFALDVVLGAVLMVAAITDQGDAAGRGLAQVYAVGCAIALVVFAAILGLSTFFRSKLSLWLSIVLLATPPILYIVGVVRRLMIDFIIR